MIQLLLLFFFFLLVEVPDVTELAELLFLSLGQVEVLLLKDCILVVVLKIVLQREVVGESR